MNAFFASVEVRNNPALQGKPVIVCGSSRRGVVSAASYEARVLGVRSAMARYQAEKLCPHGIFLPGNFDRYAEASNEIAAIFVGFSGSVEKVSTDEAFLDVTGASTHWVSPKAVAVELREKVLRVSSLPCSVGVASSKIVAKVASELAKPVISGRDILEGKKVIDVPVGSEASFLASLSIQMLWGIGPKTTKQLHALGITKVAELQQVSLSILASRFGQSRGRYLYECARGIDTERARQRKRSKSVSHETTFEKDITSSEGLRPALVCLSDAVSSRLRQYGYRARCFSVKIKYSDFSIVQKSKTVFEATHSQHAIIAVATQIMAELSIQKGVRLVGISATNLCTAAYSQMTLDIEPTHEYRKWENIDYAVDEIRTRFGADSIA